MHKHAENEIDWQVNKSWREVGTLHIPYAILSQSLVDVLDLRLLA